MRFCGNPRRMMLMTMLVLLALVLRALIPAGYMPNMQAENGFELVICGINGPEKMMVDENYNPLPISDADHTSGEHTVSEGCAFALLQHPMHGGAMTVPQVAAPFIFHVIAQRRYVSVTATDIFAVTPPPAQGPPIVI